MRGKQLLLGIFALFMLSSSVFADEKQKKLLMLFVDHPKYKRDAMTVAENLSLGTGYSVKTLAHNKELNFDTNDYDLVVAFGVLHEDARIQVIFKPDPIQVMQQIKRIAPASKQLYVVKGEKNSHYIEQIIKSEAALDLEINVHKYDQSKKFGVSHAYLKAFDALEKSDILWVTHSLPKVTTHELLKKNWNRRGIILTNSPAKVRDGMTIGYILNYDSIGARLIAAVNDIALQKDSPEQKVMYIKNIIAIANPAATKRATELIPKKNWAELKFVTGRRH